MNLLLSRELEPKDLIAIILVIGYVFLSWKGAQTMISSAVMIIVGFYYGAEHQKIINE